MIAGPEGAKNLAGECPPPDSDPFATPSFEKKGQLVNAIRSGSNRRFDFHMHGQLFIRTHDETLSVALSVNNEDGLDCFTDR